MTIKGIPIPVNEISKTDIIIVIFGLSGTGKSHFIDVATKASLNDRRAHPGLTPWTQDIEAIRLQSHEIYGNRVVLVDTPALEDGRRSCMEILELIAAWLQKLYQTNVALAGAVYMHRITDPRAPEDGFRFFRELCANQDIEKIKLVTTMWDGVEQARGERQEQRLLTHFWAKMLQLGASYSRFDNTEASAWKIIRYFLQNS